MMEEIAEGSARPRARITGVVYFLYFLTAIFGSVLVGHGLGVFGNVVNLISVALYIGVTLLFYHLFKPVNRNLSLLAAIFSLVGCAITALAFFHLASAHIPVIFFGPYCLLIGYLILRSTFLPRILGVLVVLAGLGWLAFLTPLAHALSTYIEVVGILGEGLLMLWLLVMGVNVQRWMEQASAAEVTGRPV